MRRHKLADVEFIPLELIISNRASVVELAKLKPCSHMAQTERTTVKFEFVIIIIIIIIISYVLLIIIITFLIFLLCFLTRVT